MCSENCTNDEDVLDALEQAGIDRERVPVSIARKWTMPLL
jgi:hypothetical protein